MSKVELLQITKNAEMLIAHAGRICHDSDYKFNATQTQYEEDVEFIQRLMAMGHESVFEHASATFEISEVSRSLTHQLVRHRLCAFSQRSQRYVKESQFRYVTPKIMASKGGLVVSPNGPESIFVNIMEQASVAYKQLVNLGIPKEDARFVLPNACHTTIVVTANFRQWRHMIKLRTSKHAQWEIREVFLEILKQLYEKVPVLFENFTYKLDDHKQIKEDNKN